MFYRHSTGISSNIKNERKRKTKGMTRGISRKESGEVNKEREEKYKTVITMVVKADICCNIYDRIQHNVNKYS
jgi:hypothetical protein